MDRHAEPQLDRTLVKGLMLVEALARSAKPCGVTELAETTGLLKSNVHRLLQTLISLDYVRKDDDSGRYLCTMRLWEFGELVADRLDVRMTARPFLEQLARDTQETVHLSILDGLDVIYIDKVDTPQPIRAYSRIGGRAPAYCVATGKALLAYADATVRQRLEAMRLERHTSTTITSWIALKRELEKIASRGVAINQAEWREGVNGIAGPIFDHRGAAIAAIGITCPAGRITRPVLQRLAPKVIEITRLISRRIGHKA